MDLVRTVFTGQTLINLFPFSELSLHSSDKLPTVEKNPGEHVVLNGITKEHSYSSPVKQEPLERTSLIPSLKRGRGGRGGGSVPRGRSKSGGGRGSTTPMQGRPGKVNVKPPASSTYSGKKVTDDELLSASQEDENKIILPGEALPTTTPSADLGKKLGQVKPLDKVANWLHTSREVGFRIGASHSTDSMSTTADAQETEIFNPVQKNAPDIQTLQEQTKGGKKFPHSDKSPSSCASERNEDSVESVVVPRKFFKSRESALPQKKPYNDSQAELETQIFNPADYPCGTPCSPGDPYKFIPSQKTPKSKKVGRGQGTKSRAKRTISLGRGRVRGTGRGRGATHSLPGDLTGIDDFVVNANLSVNSTFQKQSTPIVRGAKPRQSVNVSVIKPQEISVDLSQTGQLESVIMQRHNDDSDDEEAIPDSCPVNTKDEFDVLIPKAKESNPEGKSVVGDDFIDDDKEAALLFVTPAQAVEEPPAVDESKTVPVKKDAKKRSRNETGSEIKPNKKSRTKKGSNNDDSVCSNNSRSENARTKLSKAEQAAEEVKALCSLFDGVEEHELTTVSTEADEKHKHERDQQRDSMMMHNITVMNQTFENTRFNKTISLETADASSAMPPPKAPMKGRKVRFNAKAFAGEQGSVLEPKEPTQSAAKKSSKIPTNSSNAQQGSRNVRYASKMKSKLIVTNRGGAVSVNVKCAKSPGWSHVAGARKDLKVREASLNITGGEQRSINDSRTEGGTCGLSSTALMSSGDTAMTIDEETQEFDVEHLEPSQSKKERVKKLKEIVSHLHIKESTNSKTQNTRLKFQKSEKLKRLKRDNFEGNTTLGEPLIVEKNNIAGDSDRNKPGLNGPCVSAELEPPREQSAPQAKSKPPLNPVPAASEEAVLPSQSVGKNSKTTNSGKKKTMSSSKLSRKTFSLTANTQDLEVLCSSSESAENLADVPQPKIGSSPTTDATESTDTKKEVEEPRKATSTVATSESSTVSKPRPPHHTLSPSDVSELPKSSTTTTTTGKNQITTDTSNKMCQTSPPASPPRTRDSGSQVDRGSQVVPFKSVGSLCSERFVVFCICLPSAPVIYKFLYDVCT